MSTQTERRDLLTTRAWAETKWPTRLHPYDIVHTPSGPMVVLEAPTVEPPARASSQGRVSAKVAKYEPDGRRVVIVATWRARDELLVVDADRLSAIDAWNHAKTRPMSAFLPSTAEKEERLF